MGWLRVGLFFATASLFACSSGGVEPIDASSSRDAAAARDAGFADVSALDTGVAAPDSGVFADAAAEDVADPDAEAEDAVLSDAEVQDAAAEDTGALDAAPPQDAGPPCPFGVDETITATLRVTADDDRRVWVNEVRVDDLMPARTWPTITVVTVTLFRHPARENLVAVDARNYQRIDGLDRGLLLDLTVSTTVAPVLVTDSRWRVQTGTTAGFELFTFNDAAWQAATEEVQHPSGVWGGVFGTSPAWWIWTYDSAIPAAAKPITEIMAARRRFYILADGTLSDSPGACP